VKQYGIEGSGSFSGGACYERVAPIASAVVGHSGIIFRKWLFLSCILLVAVPHLHAKPPKLQIPLRFNQMWPIHLGELLPGDSAKVIPPRRGLDGAGALILRGHPFKQVVLEFPVERISVRHRRLNSPNAEFWLRDPSSDPESGVPFSLGPLGVKRVNVGVTVEALSPRLVPGHYKGSIPIRIIYE